MFKDWRDATLRDWLLAIGVLAVFVFFFSGAARAEIIQCQDMYAVNIDSSVASDIVSGKHMVFGDTDAVVAYIVCKLPRASYVNSVTFRGYSGLTTIPYYIFENASCNFVNTQCVDKYTRVNKQYIGYGDSGFPNVYVFSGTNAEYNSILKNGAVVNDATSSKQIYNYMLSNGVSMDSSPLFVRFNGSGGMSDANQSVRSCSLNSNGYSCTASYNATSVGPIYNPKMIGTKYLAPYWVKAQSGGMYVDETSPTKATVSGSCSGSNCNLFDSKVRFITVGVTFIKYIPRYNFFTPKYEFSLYVDVTFSPQCNVDCSGIVDAGTPACVSGTSSLFGCELVQPVSEAMPFPEIIKNNVYTTSEALSFMRRVCVDVTVDACRATLAKYRNFGYSIGNQFSNTSVFRQENY